MTRCSSIRRRHLLPIFLLALAAACGETGPSEQLPPALFNRTGVPLTGAAGEALAERVVVLVTDAAGSPLPGVLVSFAASAGGSADPVAATTDDRGEARTRWTLGRTTGAQTLTATAGSTSLTINAIAGPPRVASLSVNGGNNQTGVAGGPLATAPSVLARDDANQPVQGVTVFFTVISGGGSVAQSSAVTNAQGIASPGIWTLGSTTGAQLLSAQVPQNGVANNPLLFTATATSGPPASVAPISALQQTALVGTIVASTPSVVVRDAAGNPAANVPVNFAVTSGGGQLVGATQTTNAQGVATVGSWRLGSSPGTNTVTATVSGVAPVTFTATATAGAPAQLQITAGDNQTAPVNRPVPIAPQVRVTDAAGNGVAGVNVDFSIGTGDGAVVVSNVSTNSTGHASVGAWILGTTPGTNTLIASASGLGSVTFTATATGGAAASMQPTSLVTQQGIAGQVAGSIPSVVVRDAQGNPVAGVTVNFTVTAGGGTLLSPTQVTNASGVATVGSWTFGNVAGLNTVVASSAGLPNVTFNATTTGLPSGIVAFAGNNQAAVTGTAVAQDPAVRVTDINGQGAAGVIVTFQVSGGGGSVIGAADTTDVTGIATVGSWILGPLPNNTLTATAAAPGLTGNPVTFTASSATNIGMVTQPPSNATSGVQFSLAVRLQDQNGALSQVNGVPLTISINSGTGTVGPPANLTVNTVNGVATFSVAITGSGTHTLRISGAGLVAVVTSNVILP